MKRQASSRRAERKALRRRRPARRNPAYTLDRPLSDERVVTSYNNFYEFSSNKGLPRILAQKLTTQPWSVEVTGLVKKPRTWGLEELLRAFPPEERLYRLRCVEAWSVAVPWTGFPLVALVKKAEPLSDARFVRFVSFLRPSEAPGQNQTNYPWPYHEALTMAEATHELAFVATGLYGKPLPKQNGAPIRLAVPWKYGFKSAKSIVRIEFVRERPATFWNTVLPLEYDFTANVDPSVPHPSWSQASEKFLGAWNQDAEERPTLLLNGYADRVGGLYQKG